MACVKTLLELPGIITDLIQKFNIRGKIRTLQRKMETLSHLKVDISTRLDNEEVRPGRKRKEEVNDWLNNYERLSNEVNKIARSALCCQILSWWYLDNLIRDVEQHCERGKFPEGLTLDVDEVRGYELPVGKLEGEDEAFRSNVEKIWSHLMNEEVHCIGVQGMGGVGKTTLVMHIYNRIKNDATFVDSYWVTVTQNCSVRKLQDTIANHLNLNLKNEDDENIRAGRLWKGLSNRKLVIILDDVWKYYPLEKVGMPLGKNGCKLILTSRAMAVCHEMNCDKLVKVATLSLQEAWLLFQRNLGPSSLLSPEVEEIAQNVARECGGLPLGIIVLSGIMRGVNDIHEWRSTLKELQESEFKSERMEDEVFKVLQFSYQHLSDIVMQQCFLHIALYPEDEEVDKNELIQYFIDSGLIERREIRREMFDKGNAILNKLVRSCLLNEVTTYDRVKMHDLVRDMAINEAKGHFLAKAGQQLREVPDGKKWIMSLEKVSLMRNHIKEITVDTYPQCPNISTLFLQMNPLESIQDSFFRHMQALQILNLSNTNIKELPDSFSNLENLTALHLRECTKLQSLPSLAKMIALRTLDLYFSGIEEIPQGMERLCNLLYLDFGKTTRLSRMQWPTGILPRLSHLQCLNFMEGPKIVKAGELTSLRKLECLNCWFDDVDEFITCMRILESITPHVDHWEIALRESHLKNMFIDSKTVSIRECSMEGKGELFRLLDDVGSLYLTDCQGITSLGQPGATFPKLKWCNIYNCKGMETVVNDSQQCTLFPKLERLILLNMRDLGALVMNSVQPAMASSNGSYFSSLTWLEISGCSRIKKLLTPPLLPLLTQLEQINVERCEELEEIIAIEDDDHDDPILGLPKLFYMTLRNLPQLQVICGTKWTMKCDSLNVLVISKCPKLERIPMQLNFLPNNQGTAIPPSLAWVTISSVPCQSDTTWKKRT